MALRLYTNHNVFGPIVKGLRRRDVDVLTAYEDEAHELDDRALLFRVVRLDRVLFSQDNDFLAETHIWLSEERSFPGLFYVHQNKLTIGQVIEDLELAAKVYEPEEMRDRVMYLPLR